MWKNTRLVFICMVLALIFAFNNKVESAVARALVKIGETFKFGSIPGKLAVQRYTPASNDTQYLFAVGCQDGSWTTDGTNKIGSGAHLSWTGDLVIDHFSAEDAGSYTFPMEEPEFGKPKTLLEVGVSE